MTDPDTGFFWERLRRYQLLVQRCDGCGHRRHPPGPACPQCQSFAWTAEEVGGRGALYLDAALHHPRAPGFDGPAVVVIVDLDDGIRPVSTVAEATGPLAIGEPLELIFIDQNEGWTAHGFRRSSAAQEEKSR